MAGIGEENAAAAARHIQEAIAAYRNQVHARIQNHIPQPLRKSLTQLAIPLKVADEEEEDDARQPDASTGIGVDRQGAASVSDPAAVDTRPEEAPSGIALGSNKSLPRQHPVILTVNLTLTRMSGLL